MLTSYSNSVYVYFGLQWQWSVEKGSSFTYPSALGPNQPSRLLALAVLNIFALRESSPQIREEVGPLLNVLFAKKGCNGPGSFLAVVERNTAMTQLVLIHYET
jgi:hypothetical protein